MGDIFAAQGQWNHGDKAAAKKQSAVAPRRKGLTDITNFRAEMKVCDSDDGRSSLISAQDHMRQLYLEREMLMKQLLERNKMVELYGIELQKLRVNLQKSLEQNRQLAKANTHMLSQLNGGKDKLRLLEHEVACRNNLLAAINLGALKMAPIGANVSALANDDNDKPCSTTSGQHFRALSQSAAKSALVEEEIDSRRHQMRRRCLRFKTEDLEPPGNMVDTNDGAFHACPQRPAVCPLSDTLREESEEESASSVADIDGGRPCNPNNRRPRKDKRRSTAKHAPNVEKFETKRSRMRTRSSILKSEKQEDFKVGAEFILFSQSDDKKAEDSAFAVSSSMNTIDEVKEEANIPMPQEQRRNLGVNTTLQDDNPCTSGTENRQARASGLSTSECVLQVEKAEVERPCTRRQSSRLKCKDEEPNNRYPQNDNDTKPENHSLPLILIKNAKEMEREESNALSSDQVRRSSVGRPLRRAAEKVHSYREVPVNVKLRRPQ